MVFQFLITLPCKIQVLYHEALSGSQFYFSMLEDPPEGYYKKKLALQLVENALARILIIDERAAYYYLDSDSTIRNRLDKAGITIISKFQYKSALQKVIERDNDKSIDFDKGFFYNYIIIHQGILDKIKPNEDPAVTTKDYLKDFIKCLESHCDLLVVASGRGQPDTLRDNLKFLPFSNLESFILKPYHEKFLLVQILNQMVRERKVK